MNRNNVFRCVFYLITIFAFILIFNSSSVIAFGVAPANSVVVFEPNYQDIIDYYILSDGNSEGYFRVELEGDLAKYATLSSKNLYINYGENEKKFSVELKLPDSIPGGKNIIKVKLIQTDSPDGGMIGAKNIFISSILINVPYDGVYVQTKFYAEHGEVNQPLKFSLGLLNKGNEVATCHATIDILGPTNNVIDRIVSDKKTLLPKASDKLIATLSNTENRGIFMAEATIHCGDNIEVLRESFYIGNPSVNVIDISAENFVLGEIVPILINLKNNWNENYDNVRVEAFVLDKNDKIVQTFKSPGESIKSLDFGNVVAYWETKNLIVGEYDINVIVYFGNGKTTQETFTANVAMDKLTVNTGITGYVTNGNAGASTGSGDVVVDKVDMQMSLLIMLVIILVIANISVLMFLKRKK